MLMVDGVVSMYANFSLQILVSPFCAKTKNKQLPVQLKAKSTAFHSHRDKSRDRGRLCPRLRQLQKMLSAKMLDQASPVVDFRGVASYTATIVNVCDE